VHRIIERLISAFAAFFIFGLSAYAIWSVFYEALSRLF
jgi:hypothetical protein